MSEKKYQAFMNPEARSLVIELQYRRKKKGETGASIFSITNESIIKHCTKELRKYKAA
jgi:hypothetical protein